mmetsp:Transcript_14741/g.25080  ORF Transcript_14741/g.25080 Transcript_14741/m.25080 type:complete len:86 (-) Transcript_14741:287-544(-)|eukprot:CAMPEP_0168614662 /NCGR_PEP_ID=MMETSP0449_2-20121227/4097_1 /TAXON_ID=1082188 /ORGANISM="Strombidium rassoulzadegani, Strain ras09" /LENGTH=85 /DNA_ID=CAMNT_0008655363 /DNA_START=339 /DNA_END=596 /DNA_ORIENTATION=+
MNSHLSSKRQNDSKPKPISTLKSPFHLDKGKKGNTTTHQQQVANSLELKEIRDTMEREIKEDILKNNSLFSKGVAVNQSVDLSTL